MIFVHLKYGKKYSGIDKKGINVVYVEEDLGYSFDFFFGHSPNFH